MNAFIQILEQLLAAISPDLWPAQRFYPFKTPPTSLVTLADAVVFHQDASGAIGMAWLSCPGHTQLLTFPFRIARYSQDGDLVSLPPWSFREATADAQFYSHWKHVAQASGRLPTIRGGMLQCTQFDAQSSFNVINLWTDNKNACTRVETQHLCKIFRSIDPQQPLSVETEILEYLNSQNLFLNHPELTTRYDFCPANSTGSGFPVAIVTRFIQSNAKLWQDLTAQIQHARYPRPMRERAARLAWNTILETIGRLGRLLAEFHLAMAQCRTNLLISPETNTGQAKEKWLDTLLHKLNERIYTLRTQIPAATPLNFNSLSTFAHDLFERIKASENLGLLIRIHGHAHLGQVLVSDENLFLVNYETDNLDDESDRLQKQSALKDLAAMVVSLKFAWFTTERSDDLNMFSDILSPESDYGRHISKNMHQFSVPLRYCPSLEELENALVRSYLQTIAEDPAGIIILPEQITPLENTYDFCLLLRLLKEGVRDLGSQNPRYKTGLKILTDLIEGRLARPSFEALFNSPARSGTPLTHHSSYESDPDHL